jgi:hypothetical protein
MGKKSVEEKVLQLIQIGNNYNIRTGGVSQLGMLPINVEILMDHSVGNYYSNIPTMTTFVNERANLV